MQSAPSSRPCTIWAVHEAVILVAHSTLYNRWLPAEKDHRHPCNLFAAVAMSTLALTPLGLARARLSCDDGRWALRSSAGWAPWIARGSISGSRTPRSSLPWKAATVASIWFLITAEGSRRLRTSSARLEQRFRAGRAGRRCRRAGGAARGQRVGRIGAEMGVAAQRGGGHMRVLVRPVRSDPVSQPCCRRSTRRIAPASPRGAGLTLGGPSPQRACPEGRFVVTSGWGAARQGGWQAGTRGASGCLRATTSAATSAVPLSGGTARRQPRLQQPSHRDHGLRRAWQIWREEKRGHKICLAAEQALLSPGSSAFSRRQVLEPRILDRRCSAGSRGCGRLIGGSELRAALDPSPDG
jgi:hypothetical protein